MIKLPRKGMREPIAILEGRPTRLSCVFVAGVEGESRVVLGYAKDMSHLRQRGWQLHTDHQLPLEMQAIAWVRNEVFAQRIATACRKALRAVALGDGWYPIDVKRAWEVICSAARELQISMASHEQFLAHSQPLARTMTRGPLPWREDPEDNVAPRQFISLKSLKPWEKLGISRRTWFYRRHDQKKQLH
jgi:hypothetical protein